VRILPLVPSPRAFIVSLRFLYLIFFAGVFLAANVPFSRAQNPEDTVRGLARRVAEIRDLPEKVAAQWTNVSSLPEPESIILREAFLKELSNRRQLVTTETAATVLQVAVRETPTNFLVVVRVATAAGEEVRMAGIARTAFLPVMTRGNGLRLAKQLLWQQAETILDAGEFLEFPASGLPGDAANGAANSVMDIFILKPDAVAIYRDGGERLSEIQELPFIGAVGGYKYVSRGLRGEMHRAKDGSVAVALPGLNCLTHGPGAAGERWNMQCVAATTVETTAATAAPPADAQVTTLSSSCDASSWRLIGEATDWTQADRLLLVNAEMKREEAVAAVDFAGPVRRLAGAADGRSALAVVFNLASGSYEVYRITMVCGR
jgi:hypothetical protein